MRAGSVRLQQKVDGFYILWGLFFASLGQPMSGPIILVRSHSDCYAGRWFVFHKRRYNPWGHAFWDSIWATCLLNLCLEAQHCDGGFIVGFVRLHQRLQTFVGVSARTSGHLTTVWLRLDYQPVRLVAEHVTKMAIREVLNLHFRCTIHSFLAYIRVCRWNHSIPQGSFQ